MSRFLISLGPLNSVCEFCWAQFWLWIHLMEGSGMLDLLSASLEDYLFVPRRVLFVKTNHGNTCWDPRTPTDKRWDLVHWLLFHFYSLLLNCFKAEAVSKEHGADSVGESGESKGPRKFQFLVVLLCCSSSSRHRVAAQAQWPSGSLKPGTLNFQL